MDLLGEATAAGSSPYDLVRTLIGRIELAMRAGRLVGDEMAPIRKALSAGRNDHDQPGHALAGPGCRRTAGACRSPIWSPASRSIAAWPRPSR